ERYLDHRSARYPVHLHGSNGRHVYADAEAVRACPRGAAGPAVLFEECWKRYGLPIAVTECHLGCCQVAEQVRWLWEVWSAADALKKRGGDVRAVTAWALLGSYDWDSL